MRKAIKTPKYNPTLGFNQMITTTPQYVGGNGKNGTTVYKSVDLNIFSMCEILVHIDNTTSINFNSDNNVQPLNGIKNKYEIAKNKISNINKYLVENKLYGITLNECDNISTQSCNSKKKQFTKTYKDTITQINEFDIVKLNPNSQHFTFQMVVIVSHSKIEFFVKNKLFFTKVKMRMFNSQQFKKVG